MRETERERERERQAATDRNDDIMNRVFLKIRRPEP